MYFKKEAPTYKKPIEIAFKTIDYADPALLHIYLEVQSFQSLETGILKFYSNGQLVATKTGNHIKHTHTLPKIDVGYYTYTYTYSDGVTTIKGTLKP